MSANNQLTILEEMLQPLLTDDVFLVSMKIKPTNNIKVYIDADSGLSIEKSIKVNRAFYKKLEEAGLYPDGDFSLEVSSPGLSEPFKLTRQYIKNIGREVEVTMNDGTVKEGKLLQVEEEHIELEFTEGKGKKAVTQQITIPFAEIKQTNVVIKF